MNLYADNEAEDNEEYDENIEMEKLADTQTLVNDEFPYDGGVPLVYLERHLLITEDQ